MKYYTGKIFVLSILLCLCCAQAFAADYNFVIIQPGEPGTTAEAQPVMDEFAKYISSKIGSPVSGKYYNELSPALDWVKRKNPAWGIVNLSFYKTYAKKLALAPIAATLPSGSESDCWRIIVPADGPDSVEKLSGPVYGGMFFIPESTKILFNSESVPKNFKTEGTTKVLRYLRRTMQGRVAGVCLNNVQFSVAKALPLFSKVKVVYTSQELPTSPVVVFGKRHAVTAKISEVLLNMKKDPQAAGLLEMLQTVGFAPADRRLK